MLNKEEIENTKEDLKELYNRLEPKPTRLTTAIKNILRYVKELEKENSKLRRKNNITKELKGREKKDLTKIQ